MTANRTPRTLTAAIVAAILASLGGAAHAAVLAPAKGYAKPNEPIEVKFLDETDAGKKAFAKIGLAATELDGLFTPAPRADVVGADNKIAFELYTFDGKKLDPRIAENAAKPDGSLDISTFFPQLREPGVYLLTWKDATPLVIEVLKNPLPWGALMDENKVPAKDRPGLIQQFSAGGPVATHLELLKYAVITTDKGVIKAKFAYDAAPHTIDNFISLADQKFYDGSAFHRVMSGFMIQGGDSMANTPKAGSGGPGYGVAAEFGDKTHERGTLSMARTGLDVDTAGSQFFIMHKKTEALDHLYTAFGDVLGDDDLKVVDAIAATPSEKGSGSVIGAKPQIESIRALPATLEIYGIKK